MVFVNKVILMVMTFDSYDTSDKSDSFNSLDTFDSFEIPIKSDSFEMSNKSTESDFSGISGFLAHLNHRIFSTCAKNFALFLNRLIHT